MTRNKLILLSIFLACSVLAAPDPKVIAIQQNLTKLGYFHGVTDGYAGAETNAALSKYRADNPAANVQANIQKASPSALTPRQRVLASQARQDVINAIAGQNKARSEADQAKTEATASFNSAQVAEQKAITAEAQVKTEHDNLVKAVAQNASMRKTVDECNRWFGAGAIWYGIKRLMVHLFIAIAVLVVIGILLAIFLPAAKPIIGLIVSFFTSILRRIAALFTRSTTTPAASSNTMSTPTTPATSWFHPLLVKIEQLIGLHPGDANYASVTAEIAKIRADNLTATESAQLDKTVSAIIAARVAATPVVPTPAPVVTTTTAPVVNPVIAPTVTVPGVVVAPTVAPIAPAPAEMVAGATGIPKAAV
jgi:hypothetical protein